MSRLPEGWIETRLADITEPTRDAVLPSPTDDRPYLGLEHVEADTTRVIGTTPSSGLRSAAVRFQPGDTLYGRLRPYLNKVCFPEFEGLASAEFIVFKPRPWLAPKFLLYFLNRGEFVSYASHVNEGDRPRIKWNQIGDYPLYLPPLNEQRRIVAAIEEQFSRLDAAEASFLRVRRTLDVLRAAVLTAATAGLHTEELGSLVTDLRYGTSMKCAYESAGVPVLRIPNVQAGRIDTSDLKFAADPSVDLSPFMVGLDDLLFVRTNGSRKLIGRVAAVGSVGGMAFASYLIRARLKRSAIEPRFAAYALSTPSQRALIEANAATTAGQYNLNLAALRSLPVPLPPLDEQRRIVAEVERQLSLVDALAAGVDSALRRSAALRRAILTRAFAGKLVPHDPSDEPASVLLERIAAERAAAGNGRRPDPSRRHRKVGREP